MYNLIFFLTKIAIVAAVLVDQREFKLGVMTSLPIVFLTLDNNH